MQGNYYVYFITNKNNKLLYIGVTNDLNRRIYEHKHKMIHRFTQAYNVNKLVYLEHYSDINQAIAREKQLKGWTRKKKNALINKDNPNWLEIDIEIT